VLLDKHFAAVVAKECRSRSTNSVEWTDTVSRWIRSGSRLTAFLASRLPGHLPGTFASDHQSRYRRPILSRQSTTPLSGRHPVTRQ